MNPDTDIVVSVSEFVALTNQTLEFAYPSIVIEGELANFRVSKNRWVYFDLKDDESSVKFFGTIYNLNGPLEDGMLLKVRGTPRLHNLYGFSVTIQQISLSGEGTIKRAQDLLQQKLAQEGLFDVERKRSLPYPPARIGLITSRQAAAYADFTKIIAERWPLTDIHFIDVQVQGDAAPEQIIAALNQFNQMSDAPDVLILIRGGGSPEDLAAFSTESVTRAVSSSRIPTMVAIGHESDISLAELAADVRASTPSNAAELLVPDKRVRLAELQQLREQLGAWLTESVQASVRELEANKELLQQTMSRVISDAQRALGMKQQLLAALSPQAVLMRGYALVRTESGQLVRSSRKLRPHDHVHLHFANDSAEATIIKQEENRS